MPKQKIEGRMEIRARPEGSPYIPGTAEAGDFKREQLVPAGRLPVCPGNRRQEAGKRKFRTATHVFVAGTRSGFLAGPNRVFTGKAE